MGWLDWSFDQAMRADCCAILIGYEAKVDFLVTTGVLTRAEEPKPAAASSRKLTPALFKVWFG